jgi:signal peptidase II
MSRASLPNTFMKTIHAQTSYGRWWAALIMLVIVLDQFTKTWIVQHFIEKESHEVTSFFNVVRYHNPGAAFSFLAQGTGWQRWFFVVLGVVASVVMVFLMRRQAEKTLFCLALSFIMAGAIGNVIDRLWHGYVVDFIQLHAAGWFFPAFNVADSAITLGVILILADEWHRARQAT